MQEKAKKYFLSLAVRAAVAAVIFAILFIINRIFPRLIDVVRPVWAKSMDIQKIGVLLKTVLNEALP